MKFMITTLTGSLDPPESERPVIVDVGTHTPLISVISFVGSPSLFKSISHLSPPPEGVDELGGIQHCSVATGHASVEVVCVCGQDPGKHCPPAVLQGA
jgi:hypothetical protein